MGVGFGFSKQLAAAALKAAAGRPRLALRATRVRCGGATPAQGPVLTSARPSPVHACRHSAGPIRASPPEVAPIKRVHLTELRAAIAEA